MWLANSNIGTIAQVATIAEAVGTNLSPMVTDGVTVYAMTPKGLYDFDTTPGIVVSTERSADKNPVLSMFEDVVYIKNKKSLIQYNGTNVINKGFDTRQGLVSEKFGEITAMAPTWQWLFAAVKGATYAHILTMDRSNNWQYYARVPTPGIWVRDMFLSDSPDGIDRLWLLFQNYNYPGYFLNPMINPLQAGTYSFVPTGEFTPPRHDGGMAEIQAGYFDMSVIGDAIAGGNKIISYYGIDNASPNATLGVIGSNTQSFIFGSPIGTQGYKIQPRFMLCASASGTTPVFRKAIIHYLKDPNRREMFDFDIDLEKSANFQQNPLEQIIGALGSAANSKTLIPFWYGQIATKYVKVLNYPTIEEVESQKVLEGERIGYIRMRVAEIL